MHAVIFPSSAIGAGALPAPLAGAAAVPDAVVGFLHANPESQAFADVGLHLGGLLLPPAVREHWSRPGVERTFLCLDKGLRRLPWESARSTRACGSMSARPKM